MRKPLTGEPYAGELHVRFGGRGGVSLPYPYQKRRSHQSDAPTKAQPAHTSPPTSAFPHRLPPALAHEAWPGW